MDDKLTIVGPEPSERGVVTRFNKVNIEALLLMAKYDPGFRRLLREDRERALDDSGIAFSDSERAIITSISDTQLDTIIGEFSIPGVTRTSLASWRIAASVVLLVTSAMFANVGCGRTFIDISDQSEHDREGWINNNTFRVISLGAPQKKLEKMNDEKARTKAQKDSARAAGILSAQHRMLEKFKGAMLSGAAGGALADDGNSVDAKHWKKVIALVKEKGTVVGETYDKDNNCEIRFELNVPGLKKMILE